MTAPTVAQVVRVRIAPSPTGHWHIGGVRAALFPWLFARKQGGTFILRIEDTDPARSKPEYEQEIVEVMAWLGLDWDEGPGKGEYGPYRQSERTAIYRRYLEELLREQKAYWCYCSKEEIESERQYLASQGLPQRYGGHCRNLSAPPAGREPQTIRFRTPETTVKFDDIVRGTVSFDMSLVGDFVIARNLDSPLYNFSVAVDDALMKITHVIRGEEHLSNTPRQIALLRAMSFSLPEYGHVPLILAKDRTKLSKRHMEVSLLGYREEGYLAEALINFVALLGWHPKGDQELLSREELVEQFDIGRVQKAGAIFDLEKLQWMNAQYLRRLSTGEIADRLEPLYAARGDRPARTLIEGIVDAERDRARTLADFLTLGAFFISVPEYDPSLLAWKERTPEETRTSLEAVSDVLAGVPASDFSRPRLIEALAPLIDAGDRGSVLWPLRAALSGERASPDPYVIASVLGKEETLRRLGAAVAKLPA